MKQNHKRTPDIIKKLVAFLELVKERSNKEATDILESSMEYMNDGELLNFIDFYTEELTYVKEK